MGISWGIAFARLSIMSYSASALIDLGWHNALQDFSGNDNVIEYYIFKTWCARDTLIMFNKLSNLNQKYERIEF